jgi:hypothetical protein
VPILYPQVEIVTSGRGGSIVYREGGHTVDFGWEFAMPPAMALVFGPSALQWQHTMAWAVGRRAEIFDAVGAEVVRQKVPGGEFIVDLDAGMIQVNRPRHGVIEPLRTNVTSRKVEVETLAAVEIPVTRAALDSALHDHLSIEKRLAAAEALHSQQRLDDIDVFLAGQIRKLHRLDDGLERALRLAGAFPTDAVKQALLWASCNATVCAPHCAATLLRLCEEQEPFGDGVQQMLQKLDRHNSSFDRADAMAQLCARVSMTLDDD